MNKYITKLSEKMGEYTNEYRQLVGNGRLMRLILAGIISAFGSKISYFALLRKVYVLSGGHITSLGFLTIFQILPAIVFGTFAGLIIDRVPRKLVMILSDVFSGLVILSVIFIHDIKYIYMIGFLASSINVFREPAQRAMEPNLVAKADIPLLNSFMSFTNSLVHIIGAALGAGIVGIVGMGNAFVIDAVTFWLSAAILLTIGIRELHMEQERDPGEDSFRQFRQGISIMWRDKSIKLMIFIEMYLTFAMAMQGNLIYFFIKQSLHMGDKAELAWGTLLSSLGIGTVIGSFIIGIAVKRYKNRFKLFLNALLFDAIFFTLFLINTYFPVSILLFAFLGVIGSAHVIILNTVLQANVTDENRGKVFSVMAMLKSPVAILSNLVGTAAAVFMTAKGVLLLAALLEAVIAIGVRFTRTYKEVDRIKTGAEALENEF